MISSVAHDGRPQSAAVEFAETEDLKIIFDTYVQFRKFKNLKHDRRVSLVFDDRVGVTVQYEGLAQALDDEDAKPFREIYLKKLPDAEKYVIGPETRWFLVTPQWIRYTDIRSEPWYIREIVDDLPR